MGWAAGFQAGSRAAKDALDTYYTTKERLDLEKAMGLKPQELSSSRAASPEELSRAEAETSRLAAKDITDFGLTPQDQQMYTPAMPQEGQRVGLTSYQLGNQTFNRQPTQAEIDAARYTAAADVVALRNPLEAQRMRLAATQEQRAAQGFESEQQLRGLQLKEAQRTEDKTFQYETGLKEINSQKFDKPEDRTAAVLNLIEKTQGPAARLQLENQYSQNALNKITLKAKEFEDGFKQSFSKGVDATMKWLDEQDPGFTLQRVGNQIIQTNLDGSRRVFAQGTERDIMEQFAGQASPQNFLTLSKNIYDRQANADYRASLIKIYGDKTLAGRIKETETQLGRQLTEDEVLSMSGVTAKGKAGGILTRAVEQKKNDDGTYTAFDKGTGRALYNTYNGEEIPLGMTVDEYAGMKKQARDNKVGLQVGENANGQLALKFIGADGKPYDTAEAARYAKPTKDAAGAGTEEPAPALSKTNSRMGTGEANPYVDTAGRARPNAPAGAPAVGPALVRQGAAAVEEAVGSRASATRYLQGKIDRKEPLSANEKARAKQLGLTVQ
jgi:hypothetical protein